jgi:hypothetical protein
VDGDSKQEVFFSSGDLLVKLDGVGRHEVARHDSGGTFECRDLELADLTADGDLELVCAGHPGALAPGVPQVVVLDAATLEVEWRVTPASLGATLAVGNVDADAALEIITAAGDVYDGATRQNQWTYGTGFGAVVDTGDVDGDGVEEVVGMEEWSTVRGFSAVHHSLLWALPRFDLDTLLVTDVDGDARAEVVVGDRQWGRVAVYGYGTSVTGVDVAAADLDGDGRVELVAALTQRVVVLGRDSQTGGLIERATYPLGSVEDLVVADCDGDGAPELHVLADAGSTSTLHRLKPELQLATPGLRHLGSVSLDVRALSVHVEELGHGRKNLVVGTGAPYFSRSAGSSQLRALDPENGAEVWRSPTFWGPVLPNSLSYVDTGGDGLREMAFGTTAGMYLTR